MTKKEKRKMSQIGDRLRALADEVDKMAGTPATPPKEEKPVSLPSTPSKPSTPTGTPAKGISDQVSLLVDSAMAEALSLKGEGHNVAAVIQRIEGIKMSTTVQELQDNVSMAIGEAQALQENHGVNSTALVLILMKIQNLVGGGGGVLVGGTDVDGDITN